MISMRGAAPVGFGPRHERDEITRLSLQWNCLLATITKENSLQSENSRFLASPSSRYLLSISLSLSLSSFSLFSLSLFSLSLSVCHVNSRRKFFGYPRLVLSIIPSEERILCSPARARPRSRVNTSRRAKQDNKLLLF